MRSVAASSIFGYFLDLGDRHVCNILLNVKSGKCVHIDFTHIFGRARHLAVPERVPFRLTDNIWDVMSAMNSNNKFHATCVDVMHVLRDHRAILRRHVVMFARHHVVMVARLKMNVDVILTALDKRLAGATMAEMIGNKKVDDVARDVNTQVKLLIKEAKSTENLMHMFPGWVPYF